MPLGPGYTIEKQTVDVHFVAHPQPHLEIRAAYRMVNTGNRPLSSIKFLLPSRKTHDLRNVVAELDGHSISAPVSGELPNAADSFPAGETYGIDFSSPWPQKKKHDLTISYEVAHGSGKSAIVAFTMEDAFFLASGGWYPAWQSPGGTFASVNGMSKKWDLTVRVPQDYLVHAGEREGRIGREDGESVHVFEQRPGDLSAFVIAGRYHEQKIKDAAQTVVFWSRNPYPREAAEREGTKINPIAAFYDSLFGPRAKDSQPLWMVECACSNRIVGSVNVPEGGTLGAVSQGVSLPGVVFLESMVFDMDSRDWVLPGFPNTWLGFPQSSALTDLPLGALPLYAELSARLMDERKQTRGDAIADKLAEYDRSRAFELAQFKAEKERSNAAKAPDQGPLKSLLFFLSLEDKFGRDHLYAALKHMVQARKGRGYDLNDLIASLEQEAHQNVAEYVRLWLKHPGIPDEFRARYASRPATASTSSKETTP